MHMSPVLGPLLDHASVDVFNTLIVPVIHGTHIVIGIPTRANDFTIANNDPTRPSFMLPVMRNHLHNDVANPQIVQIQGVVVAGPGFCGEH